MFLIKLLSNSSDRTSTCRLFSNALGGKTDDAVFMIYKITPSMKRMKSKANIARIAVRRYSEADHGVLGRIKTVLIGGLLSDCLHRTVSKVDLDSGKHGVLTWRRKNCTFRNLTTGSVSVRDLATGSVSVRNLTTGSVSVRNLTTGSVSHLLPF
jgi:hypothetical protein